MSETAQENDEYPFDFDPEDFDWFEELKQARDYSSRQEDPGSVQSLPDGVRRYVPLEKFKDWFTGKFEVYDEQFDELLRNAVSMDLIGISSDGCYVHSVDQPPALPDEREILCDWCDRSSDEWEYKFWQQVHTASHPKVMCLKCTAWAARCYAELEHDIWTNRPVKSYTTDWNNWRPPEVIESPPIDKE